MFSWLNFIILIEESAGNKRIPPLFREMGFKRASAIRYPKGLWLMEKDVFGDVRARTCILFRSEVSLLIHD
jgi:hypothetical protein